MKQCWTNEPTSKIRTIKSPTSVSFHLLNEQHSRCWPMCSSPAYLCVIARLLILHNCIIYDWIFPTFRQPALGSVKCAVVLYLITSPQIFLFFFQFSVSDRDCKSSWKINLSGDAAVYFTHEQPGPRCVQRWQSARADTRSPVGQPAWKLASAGSFRSPALAPAVHVVFPFQRCTCTTVESARVVFLLGPRWAPALPENTFRPKKQMRMRLAGGLGVPQIARAMS